MSETLKTVAAFSGSACGAADPTEKPASACGSAYGTAALQENTYVRFRLCLRSC